MSYDKALEMLKHHYQKPDSSGKPTKSLYYRGNLNPEYLKRLGALKALYGVK